jgi:hypothetical protein
MKHILQKAVITFIVRLVKDSNQSRWPSICIIFYLKAYENQMFIKSSVIALCCIAFSQLTIAQGPITCSGALLLSQSKTNSDPGYAFLHQKYPQLFKSDPVESTAVRVGRETGKLLKQPADKLRAWLEYLEKSYKKHRENPKSLAAIRDYYHDLYLTKIAEISESYYLLQSRIARERGFGDFELTNRMKLELAETVLNDQRESLDRWLSYFFSDESKFYPMWVKYWAFTSMVKLGKYNPETETFGSRSRGQVTPFIDLNPEAFALVVDAVVKRVNGKSLEDIQDPELLSLLTQTAQINFSKLYAHALKVRHNQVVAKSTDGKWVVYKQGSDHKLLVNSLEGMNTGWCTAGENTAKEQISQGDFHVFYSKDEKGEAKIPRIAIRMEGDKIAEVRGVGDGQNLDPAISETPVLKNKLQEFGMEGKAYTKKDSDMRMLSLIENKNKLGEALSIEELHFLYEIDANIDSFRHGNYFGEIDKDPRLKEIISTRDVRADISRALNIKSEQVSLTVAEALSGNIEYHYGTLRVAGNNFEAAAWGTKLVPPGTVLPKIVSGKFSFQGFEANNGIILPRRVHGAFNMSGPTTAAHIKFPDFVGGDFYLTTLESKDGLVLPKSIGGKTIFHMIKAN